MDLITPQVPCLQSFKIFTNIYIYIYIYTLLTSTYFLNNSMILDNMYWFLFNSVKYTLNTRDMNSRAQEILCKDEWAWQLQETNYASYLKGICGRPKSSNIAANLDNTRDIGMDSEMHPVVGFIINFRFQYQKLNTKTQLHHIL